MYYLLISINAKLFFSKNFVSFCFLPIMKVWVKEEPRFNSTHLLWPYGETAKHPDQSLFFLALSRSCSRRHLIASTANSYTYQELNQATPHRVNETGCDLKLSNTVCSCFSFTHFKPYFRNIQIQSLKPKILWS